MLILTRGAIRKGRGSARHSYPKKGTGAGPDGLLDHEPNDDDSVVEHQLEIVVPRLQHAKEKLGKPDKGSEWDVYEIREAEGYTWYRIGKDRWVADGGGWVEYTEN